MNSLFLLLAGSLITFFSFKLYQTFGRIGELEAEMVRTRRTMKLNGIE